MSSLATKLFKRLGGPQGDRTSDESKRASRLDRVIPLNGADLYNFTTASASNATIFDRIDPDAALQTTDWIQDRVRAILKANPWLAGRFERQGGTPVLVVPQEVDCEGMIRRCYTHLEVMSIASALNRPNPAMFCKTGKEGIDKDEPIWKITVLTQGPGKLALVASMCHTLGDANSFFSVFEMFGGDDSSVRSLDVERVTDFEDKTIDAGKNDVETLIQESRSAGYYSKYAMFMRVAKPRRRSMHGSFMRAGRRKEQPVSQTWYVKPDWIQRQKAEAVANDLVPFVSTNDVVVSGISSARKAAVVYCPVNLRPRVQALKETHVGNYLSFVLLAREDYASPAGVRIGLERALEGRVDETHKIKPRVDTKKPFVLAVTNWTSFFREIEIPGYVQSCQYPIHKVSSPIERLVAKAAGAETVTMFRPTKDTTAVYFDANFSLRKLFSLQKSGMLDDFAPSV